MRFVRAAGFIGFVLGALALAGCNSGSAEVKGTASCGGTPIEDGSITFIPADGKGPTGGGIIKDGQFAAKSAVGAMKVVITATKVVGTKKLYDTPNSPERPVKQQFLPERYADHGKTELTFDVKPGPNHKDWVLEK